MKYFIDKILPGLIVALIVAGITVTLGYFVLTRENKIHIQYIQENTKRQSSDIERIKDSLVCIQMTIARIHPDENILPASSARKLRGMNLNEITELAEQINEYPTAEAFSKGILDHAHTAGIMERYSIDQNDLKSIWGITADLRFNDSNKPNKFHRQTLP